MVLDGFYTLITVEGEVKAKAKTRTLDRVLRMYTGVSSHPKVMEAPRCSSVSEARRSSDVGHESLAREIL